MTDQTYYPHRNEQGETVWACCESSIGPICQHRQPYESDRDFVVLSREALFQFFGQIALPPGSGAPHDTDCAPIAERIIEWVNRNDVSGVAFPKVAPR